MLIHVFLINAYGNRWVGSKVNAEVRDKILYDINAHETLWHIKLVCRNFSAYA